MGRVGRYFFRAAGNRDSPRIQTKSEQLVGALSTLVAREPQAEPEGLEILQAGLGIPEADIAFKRQNVFQFEFAESFWFGAVPGQGDARAFVHAAETEAAASGLLARLLEEQGQEYQLVRADGPWTELRHEFLGTFFAIGRVGRYLIGVERLNDVTQIGSILGRLAERVDDG
jgi:hypothetical protein